VAACHGVLVFELPAWTRTTDPRLLVLPSWRLLSTSSRSIGNVPPTASGRRRKRSVRPAGTLNAALDNDGAVCAEGALDVTLSGPDDDLDDMPFAEGGDAGRFLILIGTEVLLGWAPVLTGPRRYTVSVLRGQKGTQPGDHAVGRRSGWSSSRPGRGPVVKFSSRWKVGDGTTFEVRPHCSGTGLAGAPEVTHTFTRRASRPGSGEP
jgi:hypothetical protein